MPAEHFHAQGVLGCCNSLESPGQSSVPFIGASKMPHLEDTVAALSLKLDDAELKAPAEPYQPHRIPGHS
jgi:aryl-alcohol dehydrogenase-like predicted oxidoreductase